MKKAIFSAVLVAALAGIGWRYASPRTREQLLGFVGMAARRDTGEARRVIGDAVLPQDPRERRASLTGDLHRRIRELQRRDIAETQGADAALAAGLAPDTALADVPAADVLAGALDIIKELEGANDDASLGTRVTERILERLLPDAACKAE